MKSCKIKLICKIDLQKLFQLQNTKPFQLKYVKQQKPCQPKTIFKGGCVIDENKW